MGLRTVFRPTRKRVAVLGAIAGVSALTLAVTTPASAAKAEHRAAGKKPTIVLVHGAFADASSWHGVIKRLQHEGYPVVAPANPLRGLAGDAAYVRSVLASVKGPVVLVGHSYGGAVISEAATTSSPAARSARTSTPSPSPSPAAAPAPTCTSRPTSSTTSSPPTYPGRPPTSWPPPSGPSPPAPWRRRPPGPPGRPSPRSTWSPPVTRTSRRPPSASWPSAPTPTPSRSTPPTPSPSPGPPRSPA
ncbi:alpha/beta fold hydrolase [Streptomyces sp. NRRL WC-3744]|uniref:alpha/beta fold hydrolase n=1 Tax=Streptomyces sp. NRRL WC-3744 TaxID=1463935 RepID=UPI000997E4F3